MQLNFESYVVEYSAYLFIKSSSTYNCDIACLKIGLCLWKSSHKLQTKEYSISSFYLGIQIVIYMCIFLNCFCKLFKF